MTQQEIIEKLSDKTTSLIEVYLELQQHFEKKYGTDTVVVMEVGSFFEVYGVDNEKEKIGKPKEIAQLLNLQLTRKNKTIATNNAKNPLLAGFPTASFQRYMNRLLQEEKYTIVLIRQKGVPPNVTRYIDTILSPGVHFDFSSKKSSNFLTSLVMEQSQKIFSVGYSNVDVTTGKTHIQEIHGTQDDPTYALDGIFKLLQTFPTKEVIIQTTEDIDLEILRNYLELPENCIRLQQKRHPIHYQNEILGRAFTIESFMTAVEYLSLERRPLASQALSSLIEFVIEHDVDLTERLCKPQELSDSGFLYLGNNPLEQLDILSSEQHDTSLISLFNNTTSALGSRLFVQRITCPITDPYTLKERYDLCDAVSDQSDDISRKLSCVYDLERILRRIKLSRLHPFEVNYLHDSLEAAYDILEMLESSSGLPLLTQFQKHKDELAQCLEGLRKTFDLDATTKTHFYGIEGSLFQIGFDKALDELVSEQTQIENELELVRTKFLELLEKKTGKYEASFVQIKQLDKEGHHLSITKSRFSLIEDALENQFVSIGGTVYALTDFDYRHQTTNVKITAKILSDLSTQIVSVQTRLIAHTKHLFKKQLQIIDENFSEVIENCSHFLAQIDVANTTARNAKQFRLTRPQILPKQYSFLQAEKLRHPLVEAREENGIYVPNTICIGDEPSHMESLFEQGTKGILLYGINSSGKSSLMKSIGIAILLAQSGMYVPAQKLIFSPYEQLFTRIKSKDDFQKGLSSFAVEMTEMKNIFNRSTAKSLILGDEISRGTEMLSSLAIITASIERLSEIDAQFVLTTHLHQLPNMDEIKNLTGISSVHLGVSFDSEHDRLIFERILQVGSGSSVYGLEFAQSLHMDPAFLKKATAIRKKLAGELSDIELLTGKKTSSYNKGVFVTTCSICHNDCDEVHHITPQHLADEDGNLKHFHKDHKYNLIPLCESCHHDVHSGKLIIEGYMMTSDGLKLHYESKS
ncbi:DNA mismatch repair protein [Candidatus Nomurabacteria bacterium]|nr:DNA mismatch repair protein [Candidatus Nomurabacteria bacterium]